MDLLHRSPARRPWHRPVHRFLLTHRRWLAALCAGVAVLAALRVLAPPAPATVAVHVAAHDLPAGTVLEGDDLTRVQMAADQVPDGTAPDLEGRTLAAPVRRGETVTDVRLLGPSVVAGYPGRVAVPVRVSDPDALALVRVGHPVDVVAVDEEGQGRVVARAVPVVSVPRSGGDADRPGLPVVLALTPADVGPVVGASARQWLSLAVPG